LVVFSVDRVIEIEQLKENNKRETVAFLQLRRPLVRHLYLLFNMFKASVQEKPDKNYQTISDLFDDVFFEQLAFLDFAKPAPVFISIEANWSDYLSRECSQFKEALNRTVEKYCLFLQPEMIDLIEEIINSPFIWLVFQAPTIRKLGRKSDDVLGSYNLLARQEIRDLFKEYTNLVSELFEQYNKRVPEEKQIKLSDELWANDVPPKIGSGRP
ncbi:MAG TPA: hypothetical protein DEV81_18370, partial [Cyanobacteria bacterium UBA11049]|nr:hypothetical protein [Cyanobacteria bacterium UBA11049]